MFIKGSTVSFEKTNHEKMGFIQNISKNVWNPTFSPRNCPNLYHGFLSCLYLWTWFQIYSKSLSDNSSSITLPLNLCPQNHRSASQRLDISRKWAIIFALWSLILLRWRNGNGKGYKGVIERREPEYQNSWNMMWFNIMDVCPFSKTCHHQVHHPTPPPLLASRTSQ